MTDAAVLPAVIIVGGGVYLLQTQAPLTSLPTAPGANFVGNPYDPTGMSMRLSQTAPDGAAAKVDALLQASFVKFESMTDGERAVAAQKLNAELNIQPPLTGRETWQQISSMAGGAAGGLICNAIPGIGTVASPLCSMAGAYLGVRLEDWIASSYDDIKAWIQHNVPGAVGEWLDNVGDWLTHLF